METKMDYQPAIVGTRFAATIDFSHYVFRDMLWHGKHAIAAKMSKFLTLVSR